jgi:hypothetical protein
VILSPDLILATHQPFNCTSHHPQPPATAHGGANTGSSTPGLADRSSAPTADAPLPPPISTKALVIPRPRPRLLLPPVLSLSLSYFFPPLIRHGRTPWTRQRADSSSPFEYHTSTRISRRSNGLPDMVCSADGRRRAMTRRLRRIRQRLHVDKQKREERQRPRFI